MSSCDTYTHLETALYAIVHDGYKLQLTQVTVAIFVKQLKHDVRHVAAQLRTRYRLCGSSKFLCNKVMQSSFSI